MFRPERVQIGRGAVALARGRNPKRSIGLDVHASELPGEFPSHVFSRERVQIRGSRLEVFD